MMDGRLALPWVWSSLFATCAGCSLLVDASDLDRGCQGGQKVCDGRCVEISNPAYGCGPARCEPCILHNAIPTCVSQTCQVKACLVGFGCEGASGCEANVLVDPANCGSCRHNCGDVQQCSNGMCLPSN